jgi:ribonuclease-3
MTPTIILEKLFTNPKLLRLALTHRSYLNEHQEVTESNERLEFLGDAILSFLVSRFLYRQYPDKPEGQLTSLRTKLVQTATLAKLSKELGIGDNLLLSKGEEAGGGRTNHSLLANAFEAILGALLIDGELVACESFINIMLLNRIDTILAQSPVDSKSAFQEKIQSRRLQSPIYETISSVGPDHAKTFTVVVKVDEKVMGKGTGRSKQEAEQNAADDALKRLH